MRNITYSLFVFVFLSNVAFGQKKYNVYQTNYYRSNITNHLVKDSNGNKITGVITCEFGDIGNCSNGIKTGIHKFWHSNGIMQKQIGYDDRGIIQGEYRRWNTKGQLTYETRYNGGQPDTLVRWYSNGKIQRENSCNLNKLGKCYTKEWYSNGQLGREQYFEYEGARRKKLNEKCWNESGVEIDCLEYDN